MAYVKAAERQRQIVAAARRVLERVGVAETSLRAVAAEAEISLGTLHYIFPSKDELLRAVVGSIGEELLTTLSAAPTPTAGFAQTLRESAFRVWDALVVNDAARQIVQYELAMYSARTPTARDLARLQFDGYVDALAQRCRTACDAADEVCAVDPETIARMCLAVMDGLIIQHLAAPDDDRSQRDLGHAVEMLIGLASPRPH